MKNKSDAIVSSSWTTKFNSFYFCVIFLSGSIFSVFVCVILKSLPLVKYIKHHHIPSESYLQLRDEFSVLAPYGPQFEIYKEYTSKEGTASTAYKDDGNEQEALGSLRVALEMKLLGKHDKALKLFQHAIALYPKHPEILTKYGEFLEHNHKDIVTADQFYYQALTVNPDHTEALENRQRTANIVAHIDDNHLQRLDEKRDVLSSIQHTNPALMRANKEAYIQNIYHSVGIEGNTMSLAETRSVLETRMAVGGKSVDEHNEILGLDAAMKYINASLVRKNDFITLKDILEIHRRVLGHVDPIEGGEFRRTQVYVGGHIPPGPGDLSILMNRFERWLNSEVSLSLHPVKYAALAHYKLVHIHPFSDGNGRTSRLLMNTILMRAGYPPVIIQKQHRHKYYNFLQLANEGDVRPFVRFIADCTEKTLDLFLWATSELPNQVPLLAQEELHSNAGIIDHFHDIDEGSGTDTIRIDVI